MVDEIDYTHGDNGNKPPDGKDFQSGDPADPQEFDWYISTVIAKINEVITNHLTDSTGVHGLGATERILGDAHEDKAEVHHTRPTGTQQSNIFSGSTSWTVINQFFDGGESVSKDVGAYISEVSSGGVVDDVDVYVGDNNVGGTGTYDPPVFCTKIRAENEDTYQNDGSVTVEIAELEPHSHNI